VSRDTDVADFFEVHGHAIETRSGNSAISETVCRNLLLRAEIQRDQLVQAMVNANFFEKTMRMPGRICLEER
jgi:hypothetical protein